MDPASNPDPAIFVIGLQDANKKLIKKVVYLLFAGTLTSFLKDKKSKTSDKTVGIKIFLTFFS